MQIFKIQDLTLYLRPEIPELAPDLPALRQFETVQMAAGTLNIFRGVNAAHRILPVRGNRARIVAVYSYFEKPGAQFTSDERLGFYGRVA